MTWQRLVAIGIVLALVSIVVLGFVLESIAKQTRRWPRGQGSTYFQKPESRWPRH